MVGSIPDTFYLPFEKLLLQYRQAIKKGDSGYSIIDKAVATDHFRLFLKQPKECLSGSMFIS